MAALEALAELRRTTRAGSASGQAIEILATCLGTLRNEFRILAPYEAVDRAQKARPMSVRDAADLALTINRRFVEENKVDASINGEDFNVTARPASLVQVLDNLVHNACYWLGTQPAGLPRRLQIVLDGSRSRLLVADNGPGVHAEAS